MNVRWLIGLGGLALFSLALQAQPATETVVNVLDTGVLNTLEDSGFSLSEALGGGKNTLTAEIYKSNPNYRSLADTVGRPLTHDTKTDQ